MTDTKTSESLDKLPARKSIGHSTRLSGGARRAYKEGREMRGEGVRGKRRKKRRAVADRVSARDSERESEEALRTGYIPDWFRYCLR